MKSIIVTGKGLSKICRLCLSSNIPMIDAFSFSYKRKKRTFVDMILKCTSVQITKYDEIPNFVCRLCCIQLEKFHQFRKKALKSEITLRCYLSQLKKLESCCIQRDYEDRKSVCTATIQTEGPSTVYETKEDVKINEETLRTTLNYLNNATSTTLMNNQCLQMTIKEEPIESRKDIDFLEGSFASAFIEDTPEIDGINVSLDSTIFIKEELYADRVKEENIMDANQYVKYTANDDTTDTMMISTGDFKTDPLSLAVPIKHHCEVCYKSFIQLQQLEMHRLVHVYEKQNPCVVRDKQLKVNSLEKPYVCDVCNTCFGLSSDLKRHKSIHTGEKPFRCDVCQKSFGQNRYLKKHRLVHTGEKPFQCNVCCKRFTLSSNLSKHKLLHSGSRPYRCEVCAKSFTQSHHLKRHKRHHTGEKPYQCDVCKKHFTDVYYLKTHKLLHSRKMPHPCDACHRSFSEEKSLIKHKSLQCEVCNKCFGKLSDLKKHKLVHTGEKPHQ